MQGMDWRLDSEAGCYVSGERLRVVDDRLEVYVARVFVGEAEERVEVLRRYGLHSIDKHRGANESRLQLEFGMGAMTVEIGPDRVLRQK